MRNLIARLLSLAPAYNVWQIAAGASRAKAVLVDEYIRPFPGCSVLDLGCGTGELLDYLPASTSYTGVDLNEDYIDFARHKYGDRARFLCKGFGDEIKVDERFDLAVALGIVHHLNDEQANSMFKLAASCLKPDGTLVAIEPVKSSNQPLIESFLMSLDRGKHIRTALEYQSMGATAFAKVEKEERRWLYRIPWNLLIIRCSLPRPGDQVAPLSADAGYALAPSANLSLS